MLALATITSTMTGPGQTIGVSVFIDHFVDDLALSRSEIGGAYMVGTLVGAALLPMVGRNVDRFGVRIGQLSIGLLFALALINMSFVNGLIWLAIGFTGIRFLGQGALSLVATVTVSLRFVQRRGTAIGVFSTASGALMVTVPLVMAFAISRLGWRSTWLVAAAVVVATVVPIAWFGLGGLDRAASPDIGDGQARSDPATSAATATSSGEPAYDRGQAMRTRAFWVLASINMSASMLGTALNFHQIDLLVAAGLSRTAAAALFIPQVIGSTIAGLSIGYLSDRIGTRYLPAVGMALLIVVHWMAAVVGPGIVVISYAIVLGAMGGAVRTTVATLLPSWFGTAHLGSIHGSLNLFGVGASALGPVVLAVVEAGYGSYPPAVITLSVIPAVALLFSLFTRPDLRVTPRR